MGISVLPLLSCLWQNTKEVFLFPEYNKRDKIMYKNVSIFKCILNMAPNRSNVGCRWFCGDHGESWQELAGGSW